MQVQTENYIWQPCNLSNITTVYVNITLFEEVIAVSFKSLEIYVKNMSHQFRHKGRYTRKKTLEKQLKAIEAMSDAKKKSKIVDIITNENLNLCNRRRIVDLNELGERLKCSECGKVLSLENITKEKRVGLDSILHVSCKECSVVTLVPTGKNHAGPNGFKFYDSNSRVVLGAVHSGVGYTAIKKIFACMNIPCLSATAYKKYEREVGHALEKAATESCIRGAQEEKELVIKHIDTLCKQLPPDIVEEVYPHRYRLQLHLMNLESPSDSNLNSSEIFDEALGNIINIVVSYDMGWSKRGNGRSYDSLNGYGAIIGFLSGKILDFATRNRKCKACDRGKKEQHDCRRNYQGSAKSMEADVGNQLVNHSKILKDKNMNVRVVIGDEDSSTIASIRKDAPYTIFKLADNNHLKKNFSKQLYNLRSSFSEIGKKGVILHIKKCLAYAIAQNQFRTKELEAVLRTIPDHLFGYHENCGSWCYRQLDGGSKNQTVLLKDPGLHVKLQDIFNNYANNADKLCSNASSQANESTNNIMSHKAPKNKCYSMSESSDFRFASTVCTKNDGECYLLDVTQKLGLEGSMYLEKYASHADEARSCRKNSAILPTNKNRRVVLRQNREILRKKNEKVEGVTYQTNCGFDLSHSIVPDIIDDHCSNPTIIYFDLETSGLHRTANILQIAAKSKVKKFSVYVTPVQNVTAGASRITGFTNVNGVLYLKNQKLSSILIEDALECFLQFLQSCEPPCLLVAHNAAFDKSMLIRALLNCSMVEKFNGVILGFTDSLKILRKKLPERKGPGQFQLQTLANEFLTFDENAQFHSGQYDIEILEQLSDSLITIKELVENVISFRESVIREIKTIKSTAGMEALISLRGVVSDTIIKRLASCDISIDRLKNIYKESGDKGLREFMSEKVDNKSRVTKNKRIIEGIVEFLRKV